MPSAWWLSRKAQRYLERGAPRKALSLFDQVLAVHPRDRGAWLWSGVALAEMGRFAEARERVQKGIALDPAATAGPLLLARILFDAGQPAEARRHLGDDHAHARTLLAACLVRLGQIPPAASLVGPDLPHAPWALARLLAAIEERAPALRPEATPLPSEQTARGGVRRGLLALRYERWEAAWGAFRNAAPGPLTSYGLGVALYYLHHLDEAEQRVREALEGVREPFWSDALSILGKVDLERGCTADAVLHLRRAMAAGAATPENYYALGVGLLRQGAPLVAVRAFQRCVTAGFVRQRFGDLSAIMDT